MLGKPKLKDQKNINCLRDEYGLMMKEISFLPLGADLNTAVYRVATNDGMVNFCWLNKHQWSICPHMIPTRQNGSKIALVLIAYPLTLWLDEPCAMSLMLASSLTSCSRHDSAIADYLIDNGLEHFYQRPTSFQQNGTLLRFTYKSNMPLQRIRVKFCECRPTTREKSTAKTLAAMFATYCLWHKQNPFSRFIYSELQEKDRTIGNAN